MTTYRSNFRLQLGHVPSGNFSSDLYEELLAIHNAIERLASATEDGTITTSHLTLSDIGALTHDQLDLHVVDADIHFSDAPSDGTPYGRKDGAWAIIAPSGLQNVVEDLTPQLGGSLDLNSNAFVATLTAGETILTDQLVRLDNTSRMVLVDATAEVTSNTMLAICTENLLVGEVGTFVLRGFYNITGLVTSQLFYAGTTPGAMEYFPPFNTGEIIRVLGYVVTTGQMFFDPDKTWIEVK